MQYFVMQKAKELGIKVMFDGQGADEVFLGYETYIPFIYNNMKTSNQETFFEPLKIFSVTQESILREAQNHKDFQGIFDRIQKGSHIKKEYLNKNDLAPLYDYQSFFSFNIRELMQNNLQALLRFEDRDSMAFG
ncbi:hypothetical protein CCZ01_10015, partial [Helicobacter monodelphidis]